MIPLNAIGLLLDIFGVFFIGWSFFYEFDWKTLTRKRRKTQSTGSTASISQYENIPSYLDGILGTVILLLGLIIQIVGVWNNKEVSLLWLLSFLPLIVFSVFYFYTLRREFADRWIKRTLRKNQEAMAEYCKKEQERNSKK